MYTLLAGELPFDDDCESIIQRKVINMDYMIPTYFSDQVTDLINNILKLNPFDRLTIQQILHHPWLQFNHAVTQQSVIPKPNKNNENCTATSLIKAGFDKSIIDKMQSSRIGMLGTLWTMLLSKSHNIENSCATQTEEQTWLGSIKSWLVPPAFTSSNPAFDTTDVLLNTPIIHNKEEDDQIINTCSTCSSAADDDFDDHSSMDSSPATSVAEEDDDDDITDKEEIHRASPMVNINKKLQSTRT